MLAAVLAGRSHLSTVTAELLCEVTVQGQRLSDSGSVNTVLCPRLTKLMTARGKFSGFSPSFFGLIRLCLQGLKQCGTGKMPAVLKGVHFD